MADDDLQLNLPDRVSGPKWSLWAKLLDDEAAGHPTGVTLPGPGTSCRCGQTSVAELRVRHSDSKVLCTACSQRPLPVGAGQPVAFRLADSDLFQYLAGGGPDYAGETILRGVVEHVSERYQEVVVRVDQWATPHTVDVTALAERPARLQDMRLFWPDKTDEQLLAAYTAAIDAGGLMMVTSTDMGDDTWMDNRDE